MINAENSVSELSDSRFSGSLQTHLAARAFSVRISCLVYAKGLATALETFVC